MSILEIKIPVDPDDSGDREKSPIHDFDKMVRREIILNYI